MYTGRYILIHSVDIFKETCPACRLGLKHSATHIFPFIQSRPTRFERYGMIHQKHSKATSFRSPSHTISYRFSRYKLHPVDTSWVSFIKTDFRNLSCPGIQSLRPGNFSERRRSTTSSSMTTAYIIPSAIFNSFLYDLFIYIYIYLLSLWEYHEHIKILQKACIWHPSDGILRLWFHLLSTFGLEWQRAGDQPTSPVILGNDATGPCLQLHGNLLHPQSTSQKHVESACEAH